jgi:acyl carrier protein
MPEASDQLIDEIRQLIITTLDLEDIGPGDIEPAAPLFGDGLGLDSIDALELGVALQKCYGLKIDAEEDNMREHFYSVLSLASFVTARRES